MQAQIFTIDSFGYQGYYGSFHTEDLDNVILNPKKIIRVEDISNYIIIPSNIIDTIREYLPKAYIKRMIGEAYYSEVDLIKLVEEYDNSDEEFSTDYDLSALENQVLAIKAMFEFIEYCKTYGIHEILVKNGPWEEVNPNNPEYQGEGNTHFIPLTSDIIKFKCHHDDSIHSCFFKSLKNIEIIEVEKNIVVKICNNIIDNIKQKNGLQRYINDINEDIIAEVNNYEHFYYYLDEDRVDNFVMSNLEIKVS